MSETASAILPLKPLPEEHRAGLDIALGQRPEIEALAKRVVAGGLQNVFLTGSGGGLLTHTPVQYILERGTRRFPTFAYSANELIYRNPAALGPGSLVLIASNTGTTPEVVEVAKFARAAGATVVAYTRLADSPLAQVADAAFTYGDDTGVGDPKQTAGALTVLALLREIGDLAPAAYDAHVRALEALPDALLDAVRQAEDLNHRIADALKDEPIIYVLGSGPNQASPTAWPCATCRRCSGSTPRTSTRRSSSTARWRWSPTRPPSSSTSERRPPGRSTSGRGVPRHVHEEGLVHGRPGLLAPRHRAGDAPVRLDVRPLRHAVAPRRAL